MTYNVFGGTLNLAVVITSLVLSWHIRCSWLLTRFQMQVK